MRLAYGAKETRQLLGGISDTTLHTLAARGLLVPLKQLRHRLYTKAAIDRFLSGAARA
jgi:DNA-binding transcriptional MerR regulator